MDTSLNLAPNSIAAGPYVAKDQVVKDTKVPVVQRADGSATLPANKPFVAEIVSARLSGTEFPDQPGEIVPKDRTLRPYDTPMLPDTGNTPEQGNEPPDQKPTAAT